VPCRPTSPGHCARRTATLSHTRPYSSIRAWGRRVDRIDTSRGWHDHGVRRPPTHVNRVKSCSHTHLRTQEVLRAGTRVCPALPAAPLRPDRDHSPARSRLATGRPRFAGPPGRSPQPFRDSWLPLLTATDPDSRDHQRTVDDLEAEGGSDISRSTSTARRDGDGDGWRVTGENWFCSAADSAIAIARPRPEGAGAAAGCSPRS